MKILFSRTIITPTARSEGKDDDDELQNN